jgi:hypothetical protein
VKYNARGRHDIKNNDTQDNGLIATLSKTMFSVVMIRIIILITFKPSIIMLSVVMKCDYSECDYEQCPHTVCLNY